MAVALVTIRSTGKDAEDFWHAAAMDDGLAKEDPRKILHYFVRLSKVKQYDPHVYCRYVASAWNAAYEGRTITSVQAGSPSTPLLLLSTPHTRKAVLRYISPQGEVLHDPKQYDQDSWQQGVFDSWHP
jgi:hypothetical protein